MGDERVRIGDQYYLLASAVASSRPRRLLNHGDVFAILDLSGDVPLAHSAEPFGLFFRGTRFLDRFELRLNGAFPVVLSSTTSRDGVELVSFLTNSDERRDGDVVILRDTIGIERRKTLADGVLVERVEVTNFGSDPLSIELAYVFGSDFADMFELRGVERSRRGESEPAMCDAGERAVRLRYAGLDGSLRETRIRLAGPAGMLATAGATFPLSLRAGERWSTEIAVECREADRPVVTGDFAAAMERVRSERRSWLAGVASVETSNGGLNDWIERSFTDLSLLRTDDPRGAYPYAGIPWFATVFGRDGLFTALQTLAFAPDVAAGVLRRLAAQQGTEVNAERDEEPGKILHETRHGEMAALGEIPFGRYYGSIDSTPLFLVLLCAYAGRTGDRALVEELWPSALRALEWIDVHGDRDGDGYVEYERRGERGLVNQGWKDSYDSVSHRDGTLAPAPIALVEVQAYVYAARRGMAALARRLGDGALAGRLDAAASELRARFDRDFWLEEEGTYALALDGAKRPCRVASSNAGHALFGGIARPRRAARLAARLMAADLFGGFGVRTLATTEHRYNPMSYHNGSVWPHDNSVVAAGMARYGETARAAEVFEGIFDASRDFEDRRLPELFCGFPRSGRLAPVPYPVACKPQAWAAGSVFLLLQSILGLSIDGFARRVVCERAHLPAWLDEVRIRRLALGDALVDVNLERGRSGVAVEVVGAKGEVEVLVRP